MKKIIHNACTSDELIEARKNCPNKKKIKQRGKKTDKGSYAISET
jgi:hypothetical protein